MNNSKTATFAVAGVSTANGISKVRFSNDVAQRTYMLARTGHTDITLVELSGELSKLDAAIELKDADAMQGENEKAVIAAFIEKNTPREAAPRGRPVTLPTLADIPLRINGKFAKKIVREEMLEQLIADTLFAKAEASAKRKARADAKAAAAAAVETEVETEVETA